MTNAELLDAIDSIEWELEKRFGRVYEIIDEIAARGERSMA